jgi:eukaryotic-like serine/threonine-protein kinase
MCSPQVGQILDSYHLESVAAYTGTATVFRAVDLRSGRKVAIKLPHLEAESDPAFFARFRREEEIGRKLDHPGIVRVLSDGERSRTYMAMEWVVGRLLRRILNEEQKLAPERAVRIAVRICDALEYIHAHGVVHRDLKPENVIVDSHDNIKLIDFGIAASVGSRRLTFGKLSNTMGTPDYIAPEQVMGKRGDARSDLYALGVILYEMLTGGVPFEGPNPFAVMNARLLHDPVSPREVDPAVSTQIESVIRRAMQFDPKRRYAAAWDFAWDLEHLEQVTCAGREQVRTVRGWWRSLWAGSPVSYVILALLPTLIFILLLYVARHQ